MHRNFDCAAAGADVGPIDMFRQQHACAACLETLVTISKDQRAPHAARVSASQAILDRAYGKAPTLNTSDPTVMKRAIDMTDDELAAIASRATLHVVK